MSDTHRYKMDRNIRNVLMKKMEKISWTAKIVNSKVLRRVKEL